MNISVVFWSQSGNTAAMADAVGQGITEAGKEAEVEGRESICTWLPGNGSGSVGRVRNGTVCSRSRELCGR